MISGTEAPSGKGNVSIMPLAEKALYKLISRVGITPHTPTLKHEMLLETFWSDSFLWESRYVRGYLSQGLGLRLLCSSATAISPISGAA